MKDKFKHLRPDTKVSRFGIQKHFVSMFNGQGSCKRFFDNVNMDEVVIEDNTFSVWLNDISKSFNKQPHNKYILCTIDSNKNPISFATCDGNILFYKKKLFNMYIGEIQHGILIFKKWQNLNTEILG